MKIVVISGSPKGKNSVTYQSVRYLQKHFPEHTFEVFHVGQEIRTIAKNPEKLETICAAVADCNCVLWCYPVYTFLVPYQLVKFISLIFENQRETVFAGKYASQISTSKHFYDTTAHHYIHQISEDLGMKHIQGHCADMDDLTLALGRERLLSFARDLCQTMAQAAPVSRKYLPTNFSHKARLYAPPVDQVEPVKSKDKRVVLVTDCADPASNLGRMIEVYRQALPYELEIYNIGEFPFQGGCLGCFHCAIEGECIYRDGFDDFHHDKILAADSIILAAEIDRHWFNPIWKCYDDRQFYNGHRTSMMGKSVGYIISGALRQEANLREVLEARSEVGQLYLLDIVTDEYDQDATITALLQNMARKTAWAVENQPQRPQNFFGIGGMKVFRDLIYVMGGLMQEDHRFYQEHNLYDFPHKQRGRILQMQLVGLLMKSKTLRQKASKSFNKFILKPYEDAIERH
jgi:multimeric flavodoxin WrbA